tara:strand:- start:3307 stop:3759 length:453 start_codon:yes stop_codon:yes gene_type:complete
MSDTKWLLYEGLIIDVLEEIKKKLEFDIHVEEYREKESENDYNKKYGKSSPYKECLSEIEQLQIRHMKSYVETNRGVSEDYEISYSEHLDGYDPKWKTLFGESYIEKKDKEWEEMREVVLEGSSENKLEERREVKDKHFPYGYFMNKEVQ